MMKMAENENDTLDKVKKSIIDLLKKAGPKFVIHEKELMLSLSRQGFGKKDMGRALEALLKEKVRVKSEWDWIGYEYHPIICRFDSWNTSSQDHAGFSKDEFCYGLYEMVKHKKRCPDCGSFCVILDARMGEEVCRACGLVLRQLIATPAHEEAPRYSELVHPSDPYRFLLKPKNPRRRAWLYSQIYTKEERHLKTHVLPEIERICGLQLTPEQVKQTAILLYWRAYRFRLISQGVDHKPYVQASLILAYRLYRFPIDLQRSKKVEKALCKIIETVGLTFPDYRASDYVPWYLSRLGISMRQNDRDTLLWRALLILRNATRKISGRKPKLAAAAAIYLAARSEQILLSEKTISGITGVSAGKISKFSKMISMQ
jgi:transcription initiation factor TFIIIB Brf1 subunit/transcription initiation factor TFIIB